MTRAASAEQLGIKFRVVPRLGLADGLDRVRRLFSRFRFDRKRCARLLEALGQYRRAWDPQLKVYADNPLHDWCSDYADSLRTLATGYTDEADRGRQAPRPAVKNVWNVHDVGRTKSESRVGDWRLRWPP